MSELNRLFSQLMADKEAMCDAMTGGCCKDKKGNNCPLFGTDCALPIYTKEIEEKIENWKIEKKIENWKKGRI